LAILGFAPDGIAGILKRRQGDLTMGVAFGATIVLADLRGMGASGNGNDGGQFSGLTSHSATSLMLGEPLLAGQLRDLRAVMRHIQKRPDASATEIAVMAGSGVESLPADTTFAHPRRIDGRPEECQPAPALLALLAALYEEKVIGAVSRQGVTAYRSIL